MGKNEKRLTGQARFHLLGVVWLIKSYLGLYWALPVCISV